MRLIQAGFYWKTIVKYIHYLGSRSEPHKFSLYSRWICIFGPLNDIQSRICGGRLERTDTDLKLWIFWSPTLHLLMTFEFASLLPKSELNLVMATTYNIKNYGIVFEKLFLEFQPLNFLFKLWTGHKFHISHSAHCTALKNLSFSSPLWEIRSILVKCSYY